MATNHQVILDFLNRKNYISFSGYITYSHNLLSSYYRPIAEIVKNLNGDGYEFLLIINKSFEYTTVQKRHLKELLALAGRKEYKNVYKIVYTTKIPASKWDVFYGGLKKLL